MFVRDCLLLQMLHTMVKSMEADSDDEEPMPPVLAAPEPQFSKKARPWLTP